MVAFQAALGIAVIAFLYFLALIDKYPFVGYSICGILALVAFFAVMNRLFPDETDTQTYSDADPDSCDGFDDMADDSGHSCCDPDNCDHGGK